MSDGPYEADSQHLQVVGHPDIGDELVAISKREHIEFVNGLNDSQMECDTLEMKNEKLSAFLRATAKTLFRERQYAVRCEKMDGNKTNFHTPIMDGITEDGRDLRMSYAGSSFYVWVGSSEYRIPMSDLFRLALTLEDGEIAVEGK